MQAARQLVRTVGEYQRFLVHAYTNIAFAAFLLFTISIWHMLTNGRLHCHILNTLYARVPNTEFTSERIRQ